MLTLLPASYRPSSLSTSDTILFGMKYGYARVSTEEQNPALQLAALKRAKCQKVFKDERTGATTKRPALLRCLKALQDGDTLIVWKLDRLARSLRDLVTMLDDFHQRGIHFRSLTEDINTTTPGGRLIFHMFAALAEFERGLIIERTRAGMKAARARGVRPGPKPKLSRQQIEHARKHAGQRYAMAGLAKAAPHARFPR